MNRIYLLAALLISGSAGAQQPADVWANGACYQNGIYFPARAFGQCIADDRHALAQTMPPPNLTGMTSGRLISLSSITASAVSARCPLDRTVVMIGPGSYKCAKDLTDPE